jgi:hypothetical protein
MGIAIASSCQPCNSTGIGGLSLLSDKSIRDADGDVAVASQANQL